MTEGTKKVETHCIEWSCGRCRAAGRLPQLHMATVDDIRDAINRSHERRSFDCHFAHGIKHVRSVQDGKVLRFSGSTQPRKSPVEIPETVQGDIARSLYAQCNEARAAIKVAARDVESLRAGARPQPGVDGEVIANVTIAYRHLEDASMRLGKALQALDGGVSVYDKTTTVGAVAG